MVRYIHMFRLNLDNNFQVFTLAIIFAVALGLFTSVFFVIVNKEAYSAIYIVPGSMIRNSDNSVLYEYGVKSTEAGAMDYTLETFQDTRLVKSRQFSLNPGETLAERDNIILTQGTQYPSKISLRLTSSTATEEVHFWLKAESRNITGS